MADDSVGHDLDCRRVGQHARLERPDGVDAEHRVELRGDEVGRHRVDGGYAERVLRRERGERRAAVQAIGVERAQVGLHAGVPAGITSRNRQATGMNLILHLYKFSCHRDFTELC